MTGLAQKFGPVISHIRIAAKQDDIYAVRITAGETDLLLACEHDEAVQRIGLVADRRQRSAVLSTPA